MPGKTGAAENVLNAVGTARHHEVGGGDQRQKAQLPRAGLGARTINVNLTTFTPLTKGKVRLRTGFFNLCRGRVWRGQQWILTSKESDVIRR